MTTVLTVLVVLALVVFAFLLGGVYADTRELAKMRRERNRMELWEKLEHARRRLPEMGYYYEQAYRTLESDPDNDYAKLNERSQRERLDLYIGELEAAVVAYHTAP